jgi:hypothetical protein
MRVDFQAQAQEFGKHEIRIDYSDATPLVIADFFTKAMWMLLQI